jgi:signal transduction histidine kinase
VQIALTSALTDLRAISAGLRLPKIETLPLAETVRRAVRDHERKSQGQVTLTLAELPTNVPIPVKMTLYRLIQEALSNGYRHAGGIRQTVHAEIKKGALYIEVADAGAGFNPETIVPNGHFGLIGMRERVEMLGGRFEIESQVSRGTKIRVYLPLTIPEVNSHLGDFY